MKRKISPFRIAVIIAQVFLLIAIVCHLTHDEYKLAILEVAVLLINISTCGFMGNGVM